MNGRHDIKEESPVVMTIITARQYLNGCLIIMCTGMSADGGVRIRVSHNRKRYSII